MRPHLFTLNFKDRFYSALCFSIPFPHVALIRRWLLAIILRYAIIVYQHNVLSSVLFYKDAAGKQSNNIRSIAYKQKMKSEVRSKTEIELAAGHLHGWLSEKTSPLRSLVAFLSSGGLFYVSQCHEKSARACVGTGVDRDTFKATISQGKDLGVTDMQELAGLADCWAGGGYVSLKYVALMGL